MIEPLDQYSYILPPGETELPFLSSLQKLMGVETDDLALGSLDANLADFVQFW